MEPNKERIAEWVAELRSGNYKQARNQLKTNEGHCCMGVACEIYARHNNLTFEQVTAAVLGGVIDEVLPYNVARWFGLNERNPFLDGHNHKGSAGKLNDTGHTFDQIAGAIEDTYLEDK